MRLAAALPAALLAVTLPATAALTQYSTALTGAGENPPNGSTATGSILVTIDDVAATMLVQTSFAGLVGGAATAAHIHCCIAAPDNVGVAVGMPGFPSATSGSFDHLFDMTDPAIYNTTFRTNSGGTAAGAFAALVAGLDAGTAYFNIHDATYPGGEIRGFLTPVPEPGSYALMLAGLAGLACAARRRAA